MFTGPMASWFLLRLAFGGGDGQRIGGHREALARTEKGATVTRPIFSLWKEYSEAKGGWEDADGGGLRTESRPQHLKRAVTNSRYPKVNPRGGR